MYGTTDLIGHTSELREAFHALSRGAYRLAFQTQYFLTGPLASEEWALMVSQQRHVEGDGAVPSQPGIAEQVLPRSWKRAA